MIPITRSAVLTVLLLALGACGETVTDNRQSGRDQLSTDRAATLAAACSGCHAPGGTAITDLGQFSTEETKASLRRYRSEADGTTVMHRLARGYSDADIVMIADYLSQDGSR